MLETELDVDPRIEAFWFFGGFEVPKEVMKSREVKSWTREFKDDPTNQPLHYYGSPIFQLRHKLPLKELLPVEVCEDESLEVPIEDVDPRKAGYFPDRKHASIIPGFWPGDPSEFGVISYHYRGHLSARTYDDHADVLRAQAIMASFSWLYGQVCYQGA